MNLRKIRAIHTAHAVSMHRYGPSILMCNTSVQTAVTGAAFLQSCETNLRNWRPLDQGRRRTQLSQILKVNGYPAKYETTDAMLGEQLTMWQHGLPHDQPETCCANVEEQNWKIQTRLSRNTGQLIAQFGWWLVIKRLSGTTLRLQGSTSSN